MPAHELPQIFAFTTVDVDQIEASCSTKPSNTLVVDCSQTNDDTSCSSTIALLTQLSAIGWQNVELQGTSDDLVIVLRFHVADSIVSERDFYLRLKVLPDFEHNGVVPLENDNQFPMQFTLPVWTPASSLLDVCDLFQKHLLHAQEFWRETHNIRLELPVLRPSETDRLSTDYQLALTSSCQITVKIQPTDPKAVPDVEFHGSNAQEVNKWRQVFNENVSNWDSELKLVENLRRMFDEFGEECFGVTITDSQHARASEPCFICQMENGVDDTCKSCKLMFHTECMQTWLIRKRARITANFLNGACPHCKAKIKIRAKQTLD